MENVISEDLAQKELNEFLEENEVLKLIPNEKLKESKNQSDIDEYKKISEVYNCLIRGLMKGKLTLENDIFTQILKFPIKNTEGVVKFDKFVYSNRITAGDRTEILKGVKDGDMESAVNSQKKLWAKLTGIDEPFYSKIINVDLKLTDAICSVFFM
jgi:hypothetical protein